MKQHPHTRLDQPHTTLTLTAETGPLRLQCSALSCCPSCPSIHSPVRPSTPSYTSFSAVPLLHARRCLTTRCASLLRASLLVAPHSSTPRIGPGNESSHRPSSEQDMRASACKKEGCEFFRFVSVLRFGASVPSLSRSLTTHTLPSGA